MIRVYPCKRRGCAAHRERWQFVCETCWADVPALLRNHLSKLRRLNHSHLVKRTEKHILQVLGQKPKDQPNGPAAKAARAYARIAAQMGERSEAEAAE